MACFWTDGKPQIAIWTEALLKRLALISGNASDTWPALPLLIAYGHDWHLLIVSKMDQKMNIWEQIDIGGTRSCFDAMKVLAALHWLMDWAESIATMVLIASSPITTLIYNCKKLS